METTRRRLASLRRCLARSPSGPPFWMASASSTSSSGGEQRHAADLFQVDLDRVVDGDALAGQRVLEVVDRVFGQGGVADTGERVVVHNFDAAALQFFIQLFHLFDVQAVAALLHDVADLAVAELAGAAALVDQGADGVFLFCHKYNLLFGGRGPIQYDMHGRGQTPRRGGMVFSLLPARACPTRWKRTAAGSCRRRYRRRGCSWGWRGAGVRDTCQYPAAQGAGRCFPPGPAR